MSPHDVLRRCLLFAAFPMVFITFGLPLRAKDLGASAVEIGALFSLFTFALLIIRPLVGIGLDHWGRRPFFLMALLIYVIANCLFSFADTMAMLYLARLCQGCAAALILITTDAMTADLSAGNSLGQAMGRNMEAQARGGMIGAFIGFTLVGAMPLQAWQYSFLFYAGAVVVALLYALLHIPETRVQKPVVVRREPEFKIKMTAPLQGLFLLVFVCGFANALIQPLYLIFLQERFEASMLVLAWAFFPAGIVYAILPSRLGRLGDRFGRLRSVAAGLTLAGLLYLFLPVLPNLFAVAVAYTIGHIGWALADPARQAWIGDHAGEHERGKVFGYSELFGGVGATLGPLVGGYLYDYHGHSLAFTINALVLLVTAITVVSLPLVLKLRQTTG